MKVNWKNAVAHPRLKWNLFSNCVTNMHTKQRLNVADHYLKLASRVKLGEKNKWKLGILPLNFLPQHVGGI